MGERANVIFNTKKLETTTLKEAIQGSVVLYTHWKGYELGQEIRHALYHAKPRFGDDPYATRIMVSRIVGNQWTDETGFGLLSGEVSDYNYPHVVIDWNERMIRIYSPDSEVQERKLDFDNFMALANEAANEFCRGSRD